MAFHERFDAVDTGYFLHLEPSIAEAFYRRGPSIVGATFDLLGTRPTSRRWSGVPNDCRTTARRRRKRDGKCRAASAATTFGFTADLQQIFRAGRAGSWKLQSMCLPCRVLDVDQDRGICAGKRRCQLHEASSRTCAATEDLALGGISPRVTHDTGDAQHMPGQTYAGRPSTLSWDDDADRR